jgi:hypothetical protein
MEASELEQRLGLHPHLFEVAPEREGGGERSERLFIFPEKPVHDSRLPERVRFVVLVAELAREGERLLRQRQSRRVFAQGRVTIDRLVASFLRDQRAVVHELRQQILVVLRGGKVRAELQVTLRLVHAARRERDRRERVLEIDLQRVELQVARRLERRQQRGDRIFLRAEPVLAQADAGERRRRAAQIAEPAVQPGCFEQQLERRDEVRHVEAAAAERMERARNEFRLLEALGDRARFFRDR